MWQTKTSILQAKLYIYSTSQTTYIYIYTYVCVLSSRCYFMRWWNGYFHYHFTDEDDIRAQRGQVTSHTASK